MRRNPSFLVLAVGVALASSASPAEASGPHFMLEGNLGVAAGLGQPDTTEGGLSAGTLVGVGGRPAGWWPRFYFMAEYVTLGYTRTHVQNLRPIDLERRLHEFGLVGRVVLPIVPSLRLFGDLGFVAIASNTEFVGTHLAATDSSELDFGMRFAVGAQYRPIERFSVGVRASMSGSFDDYDTETVPGWLVGFEPEAGHRELSLQLTVYF